jgi:hypothetical protein
MFGGMERSYAVRGGTRYMLTPTMQRCREFGAPEGRDDERVQGNYGKVVLRSAFFLKDLLKRSRSRPGHPGAGRHWHTLGGSAVQGAGMG